MLAYTGAAVQRGYGQFVIDMEGLEQRAKVPMLLDHDGARIVGFADQMKIDEDGVKLSGVISQVTDAGKRVAALSDEGFPWQGSVGLAVLSREEVAEGTPCTVNGVDFVGPLSIARKSKLLETSFLYAGADSNTHAIALAARHQEALEVATPKKADPKPATDDREGLKAFLAAFPDDVALAAKSYADGLTITDVRLAIAQRDTEALKALREDFEALKADRDALAEKLETLANLEAEAGNPGVGFSGQVRQTGEALAPAPAKTPSEAWDRSERLQAEFTTKRAYEALCRREGFDPKDAE
jgi:phage head maturation protease